MRITEINVKLRDEPKLRAFVNVTFENCFSVKGLKIIQSRKGLLLCMPSRRVEDGSQRDVAHPITKDFDNGYSFYPLARPIQINEIDGIEATPFLITNEPSWAETEPDNPTLMFDRKLDRSGPLYLGVALVRGDRETTAETEALGETDATEATADTETETETTEATEATETTETDNTETTEDTEATETETTEATEAETTEATEAETTEATEASDNIEATEETTDETLPAAKMVVVGNSEFTINGLFELQLNGDVFLNSVNWLTGGEPELLSIRPQEITNRRILLMPIERRFVVLTLILLPLIGFALALILWWQRR